MLAATRREAQGAAIQGDGGHPSSASSAFEMLLNPVTSTPFSVDDILRLEREQIGSESLQLRGARRSPERFQCQRLLPEPRKAAVPGTCSGGGGGDSGDSGRRRDQSGSPPGAPCETVSQMEAERVGEPRKWARSGLGSYLEIMAGGGGGGGGSLPGGTGITRIPRSLLLQGPSLIFLLFDNSKKPDLSAPSIISSRQPVCFPNKIRSRILEVHNFHSLSPESHKRMTHSQPHIPETPASLPSSETLYSILAVLHHHQSSLPCPSLPTLNRLPEM